jgi:hypothetical protein
MATFSSLDEPSQAMVIAAAQAAGLSGDARTTFETDVMSRLSAFAVPTKNQVRSACTAALMSK